MHWNKSIPLYILVMGILDNGMDQIKKFGEGIKEGKISKLLSDTAAFEVKFDTQAKKIGIEIGRLNGGIIDQRTYDSIYKNLIQTYNNARSADFEEYNKAMGVHLEADSIKAAMAKVIDWNKRYKEIVNLTFGKFWDCGSELKRLKETNKNLIKSVVEKERISQLSENMARLEELERVFASSDNAIRTIIGEVEHNLTIPENNMAQEVRKDLVEYDKVEYDNKADEAEE